MKITQKKSKQGNLTLSDYQKENKIPKNNSFSHFPTNLPSANTLDETDCLTDHEKHIERSASIVESILSTGF